MDIAYIYTWTRVGSAKIYKLLLSCCYIDNIFLLNQLDNTYEPCHKKICLRGFQPVATQTRLYDNRRWLEARNVERLCYLCSENQGADQLLSS